MTGVSQCQEIWKWMPRLSASGVTALLVATCTIRFSECTNADATPDLQGLCFKKPQCFVSAWQSYRSLISRALAKLNSNQDKILKWPNSNSTGSNMFFHDLVSQRSLGFDAGSATFLNFHSWARSAMESLLQNQYLESIKLDLKMGLPVRRRPWKTNIAVGWWCQMLCSFSTQAWPLAPAVQPQ